MFPDSQPVEDLQSGIILLASFVCHLVDAHYHCQDQHVILTRIDGDAVAVAQAEPLLGDFRHLVAPFSDGVLVI
jgi:hypothetical protein